LGHSVHAVPREAGHAVGPLDKAHRYTRETTVKPEPLGTVEADAAKIQEKIDALRRVK
jgi:hypothetical protein